MMMDAKSLFDYMLDQSTAIVAQVRPDPTELPTPCELWDVATLAQHMLYELLWVPDVVRGKTITEVGAKYDKESEVAIEDLADAWHDAADKAHQAVAAANLAATAHLSYGDFSNEKYIYEVATDLLIHTWDLGSAISISVVFDQAAAETMHQGLLPRRDDLAASGLFAPPIEVDESADTQTRILALTGRPSIWPQDQKE